MIYWFSIIFFLSYYFFNLLTFFLHDTYNTWLKERCWDDLLNNLNLDPDLWLEAVLFSGPDRNHVYSLSNTMIEDLRMTRIILIVGCSQSILSTQTPEFKVILNQRIQAQTTHHVVDYEQLNAKMTKFRRLIIEVR